MKKNIFIFVLSFVWATCAFAANAPVKHKMPDRFINKALYENIYPTTLNNTQNKNTSKRVNQKPVTGSTNSTQSFGKRRVIKRSTPARAAAATPTAKPAIQSNRRVIQRPNTSRAAATSTIRKTSATARTTPQRSINRTGTARTVIPRTRVAITKANVDANTSSASGITSSKRCFSDYKECMESYCKRPELPYNRCYCSVKLTQIDAKYQNKIDSLIQQIVRLQSGSSDVTSDEIKDYWNKTIGSYTKTNPWTNIENALDIQWANTTTRIQGQDAFSVGHQYCVNHLRACTSMATNMRDAYKSEIARDCADYETGLQKIQSAAESVIESYND